MNNSKAYDAFCQLIKMLWTTNLAFNVLIGMEMLKIISTFYV